jgi:hypothetical protein
MSEMSYEAFGHRLRHRIFGGHQMVPAEARLTRASFASLRQRHRRDNNSVSPSRWRRLLALIATPRSER